MFNGIINKSKTPDFQDWSNVSVRNEQPDKHDISVIITMIMYNYNIPSTGNDLHLSDTGSDSDT